MIVASRVLSRACSHTTAITPSAWELALRDGRASFVPLQVVLSWRADGRVHRQVVTRQLGLTHVLASYCRDMDVQIAALLLAKGVLQDLPSAADPDTLSATQFSIGAHPP